MALGKIKTPFFGASWKRRREKRREKYAILCSWRFCRALAAGAVCGGQAGEGRVQCGLVDTGPGWRVYVCLGLCVSKSGRDGWAWPRWLVLSARRLCVFWGFLALVGFGL